MHKKKSVFGSLLVFLPVVVLIILFNTGEYGKVSRMGYKFIYALHKGNYIEASRYVDLSKIELEEIKNTSALSKHYSKDATYFSKSSSEENHTYVIAFKSIPDDKDKQNDLVLRFVIGKANGYWKVVRIERY